MKKIKITAVSYLNTKPLLYGLFKSEISEHIDLQLDIPSVCAERLKRGEVDLGLIPVAAIPELSEPEIISDYCIGATGPVRTVVLFCERPIEELDRIFLDYHSRTSVELLRILLREYWRLEPELAPAQPGYEDDIRGTTGGLVIGDRTIPMESHFAYAYDLGKAWRQHTGLPFVFAAWVSTCSPEDFFLDRFNRALRRGVEHIPELIYLLPSPHPSFNLQEYYTRNISYDLTPAKKQGLQLFLQKQKDNAPASFYLF